MKKIVLLTKQNILVKRIVKELVLVVPKITFLYVNNNNMINCCSNK
jgi:hypothetical protein